MKIKIKSEYIFLSIIVILGFLLRLYKIENPIADWHSWRQADTASVTRNFVKDGINLLQPTYHDISSAQTGHFNPQGLRMVEFPIFNTIHVFFVQVLPFFNLEVWGRLVSVLSSLISIILIYAIGRKYLGKKEGVVASALFALLPFSIYFSRTVLPDNLAITLGLFAIYFFEKRIFLSSVFFAASLLVKPFTVFYGIPLFYLAFKKEDGFKKLVKNKKYLLYAAVALTPLLLWRIWVSQYPEGIAHYLWAFNSDRILGKPSFFRWIFGERIGHLILGSWGLIPLAFGVIELKKRSKFILSFFFGSLLFPFVFATANVRHDYYQMFLVPSICLVLGVGFWQMWNLKEKDVLAGRLLALISLFLMLITSGLLVREFYRINHPEIVEAGRAVDNIAEEDALVVAPYNKDTAFLYQTKRSGWPFIDGSIGEMIEKGADYYVSVNFDALTSSLMEEYSVVEKTEDYVIIRLEE